VYFFINQLTALIIDINNNQPACIDLLQVYNCKVLLIKGIVQNKIVDFIQKYFF